MPKNDATMNSAAILTNPSQKASSFCLSDWPSIIVGFSSAIRIVLSIMFLVVSAIASHAANVTLSYNNGLSNSSQIVLSDPTNTYQIVITETGSATSISGSTIDTRLFSNGGPLPFISFNSNFPMTKIIFADMDDLDDNSSRDSFAANVPGTWGDFGNTSNPGAVLTAFPLNAPPSGRSFNELIANGAMSPVVLNEFYSPVQHDFTVSFSPSTPTTSFNIIIDDTEGGNGILSRYRFASIDIEIPVTPEIALVKTSSVNDGGDGSVDAGDTVTYTYTVTHTGGDPAFDIDVVDPAGNFSGTNAAPTPVYVSGGSDLDGQGDGPDLPIGGSMVWSATYTLSQLDIDAGQVSNQAVVNGSDASGGFVTDNSDESGTGAGDNDPTTTSFAQTPKLDVSKSAAPSFSTPVVAGDTITYNVTITNSGNVTINGVSPIDNGPDFGGNAGTGSLSAFSPGSVSLTPGIGQLFTATYTLSAADAAFLANSTNPANSIANTANANGSPVGGTLTTTPDSATTGMPPSPLFSVVKSSSSVPVRAGDVLVYDFAVRNDGNVTISSVVVSDAKCAATPVLGAESVAADGVLNVGETQSWSCTSIPATQAEVDAGQINNSVTVTGTPAAGSLAPASTTASTPVAAAPALALDKRLNAASPTTYTTVGDVLLYDFVVTNTGNVTLTSAVTIADGQLDAAATCPALPAGGLAPGASITCTGQATMDQNDIDTGSHSNTATASSGGTTSAPDTQVVNATQTPALTMVKTAGTLNPAFQLNATVVYDYLVTNSGNVTITDTITITDNMIDNQGGTYSCTPVATTDLAPGDTMICQATYTVTNTDLNIGSVTNTASASAGPVTSPQDAQTVPAGATPALSLTKVSNPNPASFTAAGNTIDYTYTVQNTGGVAFIQTITISDNKIAGGAPFPCWAPGQSTVGGSTTQVIPDPTFTTTGGTNGDSVICTATYTVTQADVDAGFVTNQATADTNFAGTPVGSAPETFTVTSNPVTGLTITKSAAPTDLTTVAVGDVITYTFHADNTGQVTLNDVVPQDTGPTFGGQPASNSLSAYTVTVGTDANADGKADSVGPGTRATFTATYTLTQADIDNAAADATPLTAIANSATGTATPATGTLGTVPPSAATTGFTPEPAMTVAKATTSVPTKAGDTLVYTFDVVNTGNVSISSIVVADAKCATTPALISESMTGNTILEVGETQVWSCTSQAVTQAEADAGTVDNNVSVTGSPTGGTLTPATDMISTPLARTPSMTVAKATTSVPTKAGDTLVYTFDVVNTGNVTISAINVVDAKCAATPSLTNETLNADTDLEVGETQTYTCTSNPITQTEVDAGKVDNSVNVSGTPAGGLLADANDAISTPVARTPKIALVKTADTTAFSNPVTAGDVVTYTYAVTNTGNTTAFNVAVTDPASAFTGAGPVPTPAYFSGGADRDGGVATATDILPGEVVTFRATYTVLQADIDAGGFANQASAQATDPTGTGITDVSHDSSTADGAGNPTSVTIAQNPSLNVDKSLVSETALFPTVIEAKYQISIVNDGNVTQTGIQVVDDLATMLAPATILDATYPVQLTVSNFTNGMANSSYDGQSVTDTLAGLPELAPAQVAQIDITVTYSTQLGYPTNGTNTVNVTTNQLPSGLTAQSISVQADSDGDGALDGLENCGAGDDRDNDGICDANDYDPTGYFYCQEDGQILTGGQIAVSGNGFSQTGTGTSGPIVIVRDGSDGSYQWFATAAGRYTLSWTPPQSGVPSASLTATTSPLDVTNVADVLTGLANTNPRILGSSESGSTGRLANFSTAANPAFYTVFDIEAGDPNVFSNNIPFQSCVTPGELAVTKSVISNSDVKIGDTVDYQIEINLASGGGAVSNAKIFDVMPVGISYVPGSATLSTNSGAATALEPTVSGRVLEWRGQNIAPGSTILLNVSGIVNPQASVGKLINRAYVADANGQLLSNIATASVEKRTEHVFDCSDIIGKVFDDKNHNGYQDKGEPGLPGVRVVTLKGTRITTDAYGRYHVPCAETPGRIGANFILKVDERSLPTGYRVTTENPRAVRVTAGKFAKLNFGASISSIVRIDINQRAFASGDRMHPKFAEAIDNLVRKMSTRPSMVRLTYIHNDGATHAQARQRLDAVEERIRQTWRRFGQYKLNIERTIKRRN